ncbi:MAG: M23 family metallopeptidase, partial [Anaerolineae bacterium]|nr:M23 family metallopeptidase [Anaerolineae bacterium]
RNTGPEAGEEFLPNMKFEYRSLKDNSLVASCVTNEYARCEVKVPEGTYNIYLSDPSGRFKYIFPDTKSTLEIDKPLTKIIDQNNKTVTVPIAEGFLVWPFPRGTSYIGGGLIKGTDLRIFSLYDVDLRRGHTKLYDPEIDCDLTTVWSACTYDQHDGIDIAVPQGTQFLAAAPLKIEKFEMLPTSVGGTPSAKREGAIEVWYVGTNYYGIYGHVSLLKDIKIGDIVEVGQPFGFVGPTYYQTPHLHFGISYMRTNFVDPFRDLTNPKSRSLWTVDNKPQYFR